MRSAQETIQYHTRSRGTGHTGGPYDTFTLIHVIEASLSPSFIYLLSHFPLIIHLKNPRLSLLLSLPFFCSSIISSTVITFLLFCAHISMFSVTSYHHQIIAFASQNYPHPWLLRNEELPLGNFGTASQFGVFVRHLTLVNLSHH